MTKKQKKMLCRILLAALCMVILHFIPAKGWVRYLLYLIPYLIVGYDILKKAVLGIVHGEVFDENFLMAVATVGAIGIGDLAEGVFVMLFYQVGELFQSYAVGKSRRNITQLMDIRPDYANIEQDGELVQVDPDEVSIGTVIVVKPGEKIPIDGVVAEGESALNTGALTGESLPREVSAGDEVISGCVNLNGLLKIRTTKEFGESTVSKILDLVENSSMKKSRSENFITRFARVYTPAVCIGAVLLAVVPPLLALLIPGIETSFIKWFTRALTFLVISCPCALVISIPLSFFGGIGGASAKGILVKGSNYLEALAKTKVVVFDKTGTMTKGVFEVTKLHTENVSKELLLYYAAAAERYSTHPISKSLLQAYEDSRQTAEGCKQVEQAAVTQVEEISGHGVKALVDGKTVAVGNRKLMAQIGIACGDADGIGTEIHVALDGVYAGWILISDVIKQTAAGAIRDLKASGVKKTVMLTGDSEKVAQAVAAELSVDEVKSELLPADKVAEVERLLENEEKGEVLAFVGDGINDAPVLSRADIGIAMGALGSDAAIEAADIVLMDDDPAKIALAMRISRKTLRIVYQNIVFALGVKAVCLILGALGIANMWWAIFADVGVMVLAVLNATRALIVKTNRT
ncbi:MAG: heavy metal translocating P-type ATPase [Lachnospiraceae bacterium]